MNRGVVFTQQGVPVAHSSDYQKVIDSRWEFMEIEQEQDINIVLPAQPAIDSTRRYYEKTIIYRHNLNFLPAFEASISFGGDPFLNQVTIHSDENTIFLRRLITSNAYPQQTITGMFRLYNVNILKEYEAPTEIISGASAPKSGFGLKFIDGKVPNITPADDNSQGFSVDTTKKILSIHKHGTKYFNPSVIAYQAECSAIDTTTNILTLVPRLRSPGPPAVYFDLGWITTPGHGFAYSPHDFVTYPSPLNGAGIYYNIPVDATHIKLAGSQQAAIDGVEIDLTTAGSLNGILFGQFVAGEDTIIHGVGYPPTFLMAAVNEDELVSGLGTAVYIDPIQYDPGALIKADAQTLRFSGVQAVFTGKFGYIILKDPTEIAQ